MMKETTRMKIISDNMSYWKAHFTAHDMLASELSYSFIYDNIHPSMVSQALETVGLSSLPNRFFLIQVDNYQNYASTLQVTQEFFQKKELINTLRTCLTALEIEGFVANMVGMDYIFCYLQMEETGTEKDKQRLLFLADYFKQHVRKTSTHTISVCISERCTRLSQYSIMYPRMHVALSRSFFSGKEFSILLEDIPKSQMLHSFNVNIENYYPEIIASIARANTMQFRLSVQNFLQVLLQSQASPQKIHLELIRLLQKVEGYCIRSGMPEEQMLSLTEKTTEEILSSSFIADIQTCFEGYFKRLSALWEKNSSAFQCAFKEPIQSYIEEHFHENIRIGNLALMMGFSEGHFARLFKDEFGKTFVQFLTEFRMEKSKKILQESSLSIEQVAEMVGIFNYSYFCTCFKRHCGSSPSVFRRENQHALRRAEQNKKTDKRFE